MPAIYHVTHGKNLELIIAAGELRASATAETLVDIADAKIKGGRETRMVTCGPGGCVGDYVPFYFAPRSPMLFRIQAGGVEGVDGDPRGLGWSARKERLFTEEHIAVAWDCLDAGGGLAGARALTPA